MKTSSTSSLYQRAGQWLVLAAFLGFGLAMAESEPTLSQVYAAAQSGKLDQAQLMIQQVLIGHPKSAKAHFVRAELFARQGDLEHARESLATADKLSPGLSFAKAESVQALRTQLAAGTAGKTSNAKASAGNPGQGSALSSAPPVRQSPAAPASSSSWGLPLLLAGAAVVAGYFIFRRRNPVAPMAQQAVYSPQGGLGGTQTFGMGAGVGAAQPGYPQPGAYPQHGGYPQQPGSGLGGRIMGGVATGLAVGAGVMAAQAIARTLSGDHGSSGAQADNSGRNEHQPVNNNPDMGGADFGVDDGGSWDSGGDAGGGDWDN